MTSVGNLRGPWARSGAGKGGEHSCIHGIDEGMIPRDAHQTTRTGQEDAREKRPIVLALPAINMKQQIKKDEKKRKRKQETECEKTKEVAENQNEEESEEEEEEEEHWSHNFAKQLIEMNEGSISTDEQQITMIPNPLFSDFYL
ncbi:hypothetical protein K1719_037744 [Acacia pycnantha]|nr:hypothetical protein K1719_037744 [Acacia pycnantha]